MKILLICMQHDYGIAARGFSYEYMNFYKVLSNMGHEVTLFDFMAETVKLGKDGMNHALYDLVIKEKPSLAFFILYTDQFYPETVKKIGEHAKTLCFFHDDTWRVDFTRFWAEKFDYFTTPDIYGEYKYKQLGLNSAIYFPFGCNKEVFTRLKTSKKIDVSFVGAWHPYRNWVINNLRKAGFRVEAAGFGWPKGSLSHEDMVRLFNESKINLNLSNSTSWDIRYLMSSPRALVNLIRSPKNIEQIKARHFEISSCGAFQLSYYVEGLERQYEIGKEIGIYLDQNDLVQKVKFYLENEDLREEIAERAYQRSLTQHCFESRFETVFSRMGLSSDI